MACVFQRQIREFKVPAAQIVRAREFFLQDVQSGAWSMLPLSEPFLFRVASSVAALPASMYLRAGDAIHLATAQEAGFSEIWSNDRRVLEAAPAFGLTGKSI
jgi:predicted nucleic acid-binding protein